MTETTDAVLVATVPVPGLLASRSCVVRDGIVYAAGVSNPTEVGVIIVDVAARRAELVPLPFRVPLPSGGDSTELDLVAVVPSGIVFVLVARRLSFVCEWRIADRAWFLRHKTGAPVPFTAELLTRDNATLIGDGALRIWVEPDGRLEVVVDGHVGHPYGDDIEWGKVPPAFVDARDRASRYARELGMPVERIDPSRPGVWSQSGTTPRIAVRWTAGSVRHRVIFAEAASSTTAFVLASS